MDVLCIGDMIILRAEQPIVAHAVELLGADEQQ
jgi:hypothetical protein